MRNKKYIREQKNKFKGYRKLLERDYDWDYNYLLILIRHKLKRMEHCIRKEDRHIGVEKKCKKMRICISLLDRITEDNYINEEYSKALDEWSPFRNTIPVKNKNGEVIGRRISDPPPELEKRLKRYSNHMEYLKKQDWDYLFKLLHKYMQHWWT